MNYLTRIRTELGKAERWQTLLCAIPFVFVCCMGLKGFANLSHPASIESFLFGMFFLFLLLVKDWREGKTNLRWLAGLCISLLVASNEPKTFCLTGIAAIFCFRVLFLISAMLRLDTCFWPKQDTAAKGKLLKNPMFSFLPSFGCALVIFSFIQMLGTGPVMVELQHYRSMLEQMWSVTPLIAYMAGFAMLAGIWLPADRLHRWWFAGLAGKFHRGQRR